MSLPAPKTAATPAPEHAVIYVGAASVSMIIGLRGAERLQREDVEHLDRPLPLARDIFRSGSITRSTVEQAVAILRDYLQTTRELGIPLTQVRLFTTNILAEAANHEIFLNRLEIQTGVSPSLIDDGNMTRLVFQISQRLLKKNPRLAQGRTFVTHIGPGNTRAMYFDHGRLAAYSNYRLGIFRAREAVSSSDELAPQAMLHLEEQIRGVVDHLAQDYSGHKIDHHVATGAEIQSVAPKLAKARQGAFQVHEDDLARLTEKLARMSPDQLVRELHVHYTGGEGIVPALQTNLALAKRFGDQSIWVPEGDFHFELMLDLMTSGSRTAVFQEEVMQSACEIGVRYKTDRKHAEHVALFAQQLFRELQHLHGLDPKFELVLRVAATLHEVGMFISPREHHKHSLYILLHTEIFGLSTQDRELVALLARYHRRYNPEPNHPTFSDLSREDRMIVLKLAAILRIADSLDRSHAQRVKSIQLRPEGPRLRILTHGIDDNTIEQIAIDSKCDLFREIYGYEVVLAKS
ncbi:MAG: HD domain-containing protein [Verrucomicrobiaceae bacterium]|nr:HD domain-containing protein [Verrucomicrobiaceae bacterium]